jgi:hypothetical protein
MTTMQILLQLQQIQLQLYKSLLIKYKNIAHWTVTVMKYLMSWTYPLTFHYDLPFIPLHYTYASFTSSPQCTSLHFTSLHFTSLHFTAFLDTKSRYDLCSHAVRWNHTSLHFWKQNHVMTYVVMLRDETTVHSTLAMSANVFVSMLHQH